MATTAVEILSLAEAKEQLRVTTPDTDALITMSIESAVSYVAKRANVALLDKSRKIDVLPFSDTVYVRLITRACKSITTVKYWLETQSLRELPTGTIGLSKLGRRDVGPTFVAIWPPPDGWPKRKNYSPIRFTFIEGLTLDGHNQALKQAVILAMREFFIGHRELPESHPLNNLIRTWDNGRSSHG